MLRGAASVSGSDAKSKWPIRTSHMRWCPVHAFGRAGCPALPALLWARRTCSPGGGRWATQRAVLWHLGGL